MDWWSSRTIKFNGMSAKGVKLSDGIVYRQTSPPRRIEINWKSEKTAKSPWLPTDDANQTPLKYALPTLFIFSTNGDKHVLQINIFQGTIRAIMIVKLYLTEFLTPTIAELIKPQNKDTFCQEAAKHIGNGETMFFNKHSVVVNISTEHINSLSHSASDNSYCISQTIRL